MIYLQLFWEFFKIGLFAIGGGMATIPFLQALATDTAWFSPSLIPDMVAISESTPGPLGINMATYVGYQVGGLWGGILASLGIAMPSLCIVCLIAKSLSRFRENPLLNDTFYGLRPAVTGLIAAAGWEILKTAVLTLEEFAVSHRLSDLAEGKRLLYFAVIYYAISRWKKHPILYIGISAVVGFLLAF